MDKPPNITSVAIHLCVLLFIIVGLLRESSADRGEKPKQCVPITIPMCKGIYNNTYMPNQFNHQTQEEAGLEVSLWFKMVY